ncbi:hypothetical protein COL5a_006740 [Colletotrichum fioriniae]|uniref:uncharacterized protein n=1 Tax=Colletotrichum fioriniae TaxID=710243 RepID=UPI002301DBE6|nr:uncharacterized protein COL516b_008396 [Colletotrichum fioriniae]KAJ0300466.1 hypothetical protein COL516b_008396 [Colletotrichum fioriniae]KAJ0326555.1 hypothetical protein COL5a_006740 [Colletotrichum fioriniae]KAJ3949932.1 hypothetical protein N0V96_001067 [Colletotrichum fioriniae]
MADRARSRSRSPRRDRDRDRDRDRPRKQGGFRWKDKSRRDDRDDGNERRGLERGYRNRSRSPRRDRDRDSDRDRRNDRRGGGDDNYRPRDSGRDRDRERDRGDNNKPTAGASSSKDAPTKPKKEKSVPAPAAGGSEEMIIVHVNDRLGTKAAIPCLASDPVKMFKIMVAQRVGREPHEILLKRQGERPFKDNLTLEDYGVSNGVQLDLEVDTGD